MPNRWEMPPVYLQSGDPEQESVSTLHAPGLLGARFTVYQPSSRQPPGAEEYRSKRYQIIKTDSSMAVGPFRGAVGWWADQANYLVTCTSPAVPVTRNRLAGVFCRTWEHAGDYMCVQIQGPGLVKLIDAAVNGNVVPGAFIIPSATNAKADVVATATAPTQTPLGQVSQPLTYNAASKEVVVDLAIPETT
jgi:hypothetical protein